MCESGNSWALTEDKIAFPASRTDSAMASIPADSHSLPGPYAPDVSTHSLNKAGHFVPGDAWQAKARPDGIHNKLIAVTNSTRINLDAHFTRTRLRNRSFLDKKWLTFVCDNSYFRGALLTAQPT